MNGILHCYASAAFGMEGLVSKELKSLGISNISTENGGVHFYACPDELFRCNLKLHFTDRIYIVLAISPCKTFSSLFDLVYSISWETFCCGNEAINVSCRCVRSTLMSTRDCQSIAKKAIIEKIRHEKHLSFFPENGASFPVLITIRNDEARILLNTSGDSLSKRGYRTWNGEAPLRETLAAALVELSPWRPEMPLHDPCCGTGTILVEAAMMATHKAPGINRHFSMESGYYFRNENFSLLREETAFETNHSVCYEISGSDIDSSALSLASKHIIQAGFRAEDIHLSKIGLQDLSIPMENGVFICNPPYGERISDQKNCRILYHELFQLKMRHPTWHLCAISSDPAFERSFGKKADRKRRLYNGRLECVYYIYY